MRRGRRRRGPSWSCRRGDDEDALVDEPADRLVQRVAVRASAVAVIDAGGGEAHVDARAMSYVAGVLRHPVDRAQEGAERAAVVVVEHAHRVDRARRARCPPCRCRCRSAAMKPGDAGAVPVAVVRVPVPRQFTAIARLIVGVHAHARVDDRDARPGPGRRTRRRLARAARRPRPRRRSAAPSAPAPSKTCSIEIPATRGSARERVGLPGGQLRR